MTWRERAACRNTHPDLFFPEKGDNGSRTLFARRLCTDCPVKQDCLDYAITEAIFHGIWGGMSVDERNQERARRNRAKKKNGVAA